MLKLGLIANLNISVKSVCRKRQQDAEFFDSVFAGGCSVGH